MLGKPSIASWKSWFRSNSIPATFTTRDNMIAKLADLFKEGKISEESLDAGKIAIEEAGNKLVYLYRTSVSHTSLGRITDNLEKFGVSLSSSPMLATSSSTNSSLVYAVENDGFLRFKWTEIQTRWISNLPSKPTYRPEKQPKIVLFILDKKTGAIQMRYDKPERDHEHKENGRVSKEAYFMFYREKAEAICGSIFEPVELRPKLDQIVKTIPRIVEVMHNEELTEDGFTIKWSAMQRGKDIRDGKHYTASEKHGGTLKTQEKESVRWLPEASGGGLSRPVTTYVDGKAGYVRFDAYCHDQEVSYVLTHFV
jgi:hypothetical protein